MSLQDAFCMIHQLQIQTASREAAYSRVHSQYRFPFFDVTVSLIQDILLLPFNKYYQMLTRISSEQYTSVYEHSKCIYGSPNLLVMERAVKY